MPVCLLHRNAPEQRIIAANKAKQTNRGASRRRLGSIKKCPVRLLRRESVAFCIRDFTALIFFSSFCLCVSNGIPGLSTNVFPSQRLVIQAHCVVSQTNPHFFFFFFRVEVITRTADRCRRLLLHRTRTSVGGVKIVHRNQRRMLCVNTVIPKVRKRGF